MFPKAVSHLWVSHDAPFSPHRPHLLLDCFKCTCRTRQKTRAYTTDILYHTPHTQPGVDGGCSRLGRWRVQRIWAMEANGGSKFAGCLVPHAAHSLAMTHSHLTATPLSCNHRAHFKCCEHTCKRSNMQHLHMAPVTHSTRHKQRICEDKTALATKESCWREGKELAEVGGVSRRPVRTEKRPCAVPCTPPPTSATHTSVS